MALLDTARRAFAQAREILGEQRLFSIGGGPALDAIEAGARVARDYDELVHSPEESVQVVIPAEDFKNAYPAAAASYLGNLVTLDSEEWRLGEFVEYGRHFVVIELVSRQEAA